jgi:homoserine O-acetyltransferase
MGTFNVEVDLHKIRTRLLYVLADSDEWFPASIGHQVMANLKSAGVDAEFVELHSPYGHYATTRQPEKWVKHAARLLHQ